MKNGKVVVYFNQWFTSIGVLIKDIKKKFGNKVFIIGSSLNKDCAYQDSLDMFIHETWETPDENNYYEDDNLYNSDVYSYGLNNKQHRYMTFIRRVLVEQKVDVFFCRKNCDLISEFTDSDAFKNVITVLENKQTLTAANNKISTYKKLEHSGLNSLVPEYFNSMTMSPKLARKMMHSIVDESGINGGKEWCFKKIEDEGAFSFRRIENAEDLSWDSLSEYKFGSISKRDANKLIDNLPDSRINEIMFMEMLDEPEISIDCYNSSQGFIALCREKIPGTRVQRLYYNAELAELCRKIGVAFNFKYPFNVQLRPEVNMFSDIDSGDEYLLDDLKLLEVNPRLSGGSYYATLIGLNILEVCLIDLVGNKLKVTDYDIDKFSSFDEMHVTYIENPIIIENT